MRVLRKIGLVSLLVGVFALGAIGSNAYAQNTPMTEDQMGRIRANCSTVKASLNRLHETDALLRINRGQIYESMSTKLMSRFNGRADSSRFDVSSLASVTQDYTVQLATFRQDYIAYEVQLNNALNIDCSKEPVSFYDAIASARTKRTQVHGDVLKLHQYISNYKTAFDTFTTEFYKTDGASK